MLDSLVGTPTLPRLRQSRVVAAGVLVLLAVAFPIFFRYLVRLPSPEAVYDSVSDASIYFTAERTFVWAGGDCVTLRWDVDGIDEVFLGSTPVTGHEERVWCLWPESLAGRPTLRVHFTDDTWKDYVLDIHVMQPLLLYTSVPLVILAAWVMQLRVSFPDSLRRRLTDENSRLYWFTEPFLHNRTFHVSLIYVFVAINALVAFNVVRHNPREGYDAEAHLAYIQTLANFRLPDAGDSYEYFSPPLPYAIPAASSRLIAPAFCSGQEDCDKWTLKIAQLQNVFLSVGLTFMLLKVVGVIRPDQMPVKLLALGILGLLPVYYKAMTIMHGEPFLAFFTLVLVYMLVTTFNDSSQRKSSVLAIGIVMGLLLLSRQWGTLIIGGTLAWLGLLALKSIPCRRKALTVALASTCAALIVGGWFYLSLHMRFGSIGAFNREATSQTFTDPPREFYLGLGNGALFTAPYREAFPDQILPKFYTEIWGDYEGYFITYQYEDPPTYLLRYLGRVNAVSLLPTALLLAGLGVGVFYLLKYLAQAEVTPATAAYALLFLCIAVSLTGYLWFLVRYPSDQGDTIKAGYMLQIFPLVAILSAEMLDGVRRRQQKLYYTVILLLGFVVLHNLPAMMTRRTEW